MNRDQLARLFTVTPGTIHRWDRDGMPRAVGGGSGRQAQYRPSACVTWRHGQIEAKYAGHEGLNPAAERARRDHHQAALAEQLHKKRSGEMLEFAEVRHAWSSLVIAVRARLLRMPTALADALAHASAPAEAQRILDAEVRDALTELSHGTPPADTTTPPDPTPRKRRTA
jgi:phage terminase Nu1 subunit (DNA packaging protein)